MTNKEEMKKFKSLLLTSYILYGCATIMSFMLNLSVLTAIFAPITIAAFLILLIEMVLEK